MPPGRDVRIRPVLRPEEAQAIARLDEILEERRSIAAGYADALEDVPAVELYPERPGTRSAWHLYPIRLRLEAISKVNDPELWHRLSAFISHADSGGEFDFAHVTRAHVFFALVKVVDSGEEVILHADLMHADGMGDLGGSLGIVTWIRCEHPAEQGDVRGGVLFTQ